MNNPIDNSEQAGEHGVAGRALGRVASTAGKVEDGLGFFFGNVLTIFPAILVFLTFGELVHRNGGRDRGAWVMLVTVGGGWLLLDVPYLARLWRVAFRGRRPWALETAARQRMAPRWLRPVVALWWFAHFAMGIGFAIGTGTIAKPEHVLALHVMTFGMVMAYGFAANGYLMLAVCALTPSPQVRMAVRHQRRWIDLALGFSSLFIPTAWFKGSW